MRSYPICPPSVSVEETNSGYPQCPSACCNHPLPQSVWSSQCSFAPSTTVSTSIQCVCVGLPLTLTLLRILADVPVLTETSYHHLPPFPSPTTRWYLLQRVAISYYLSGSPYHLFGLPMTFSKPSLLVPTPRQLCRVTGTPYRAFWPPTARFDLPPRGLAFHRAVWLSATRYGFPPRVLTTPCMFPHPTSCFCL
jgi:hypothetical protein